MVIYGPGRRFSLPWNLPASGYWTRSLQNCEKHVSVVDEPPCLSYFLLRQPEQTKTWSQGAREPGSPLPSLLPCATPPFLSFTPKAKSLPPKEGPVVNRSYLPITRFDTTKGRIACPRGDTSQRFSHTVEKDVLVPPVRESQVSSRRGSA